MNYSYWENKEWFNGNDFTIVGSGIVGLTCAISLREKFPNSKIIISGIGMKGGKQFYKSERSNLFVYDSRAKVDRYMMELMVDSYKERLFTTDLELFQTTGIKMWHGNLLQL